jgi:hypothetical protein
MNKSESPWLASGAAPMIIVAERFAASSFLRGAFPRPTATLPYSSRRKKVEEATSKLVIKDSSGTGDGARR